jgi:hypothetical protein
MRAEARQIVGERGPPRAATLVRDFPRPNKRFWRFTAKLIEHGFLRARRQKPQSGGASRLKRFLPM